LTQPQQLAAAAASIAEALSPLTLDARKVAVDMALMMCPAEPVKRSRRDKGMKRKERTEEEWQRKLMSDDLARASHQGDNS